METELSPKLAMKFARHIMLPNFDFDKQLALFNASALIIGSGGLGCAVSQYLVASGIGKVTVVDDDKVEIHNLPRQILFDENDIGSFKAQVTCTKLMQRHPESHLVATCQRLDDESAQIQIAAHDIVIDCSDNLATRQQLNRLCYSGQTPLVSGAAIRMEGQLFCVEPAKKSACYECFSQFFQEQSLSCHEAGVLSPIVGIIGNLQALEVIKIVTQYGESLNNTLILFDGMRGEWQKLKVKKSTACQVCNA